MCGFGIVPILQEEDNNIKSKKYMSYTILLNIDFYVLNKIKNVVYLLENYINCL